MNERDDLNALLSGAVDHATDLLAEHNEFAPFALAMQLSDGELFHIEPDEPGDATDSGELMDALVASLSEARERWRAIGIVADGTLEDDDGEAITSVIHISMEHIEGEAATVLVPYAINDETVELGELVAEPMAPQVFVKADAKA